MLSHVRRVANNAHKYKNRDRVCESDNARALTTGESDGALRASDAAKVGTGGLGVCPWPVRTRGQRSTP